MRPARVVGGSGDGSRVVCGPLRRVAGVFGQAKAGGLGAGRFRGRGRGSGERRHGAESFEGGEELVFPGPPCGHAECDGAGGARDPAGNGEQPAA